MPEVLVVNNNDFPVKGRYGGKDYIFEPGQGVAVELEAVKHMFAWNQPERVKAGALNRLGLLTPPNGSLQKALEALDRIAFLPGRTVFEEPSALPQPIGEDSGALRNPGGEPEAKASGPLPLKRRK
jgi:hypothetical protein